MAVLASPRLEAVPVRGAPRIQNRTTDHGQLRFLLPCALRLQAQRRDAGRVAGLVRRAGAGPGGRPARRGGFCLPPAARGGGEWAPRHGIRRVVSDAMTASTAPPEGSFLATGRGRYLDGRTVAGLRDGQPSEVIKRDGSIAIGQWGRDDVTMTPRRCRGGRGAPPFPMPRRLDQ